MCVCVEDRSWPCEKITHPFFFLLYFAYLFGRWHHRVKLKGEDMFSRQRSRSRAHRSKRGPQRGEGISSESPAQPFPPTRLPLSGGQRSRIRRTGESRWCEGGKIAFVSRLPWRMNRAGRIKTLPGLSAEALHSPWAGRTQRTLLLRRNQSRSFIPSSHTH